MNVRKNAASLPPQEWERLLRAFITLKHTFAAGSNVSVYDQFVAIHQAVTRLTGAQTVDGAHRRPGFFPWHREYLKRLEQALQSVDARVSIPYWNWGLGGDAETLPLFQDARIGPMGSGGASGREIMSGYFAQAPNAFNPLGWAIHPMLRPPALAGPGMQRNPFLDTSSAPWPTDTGINTVLGLPDFELFRPALESPPHDIIHGRMGRHMAAMTSPNDPIFFLHHAQVDRLWARWQQTHPGSANYNPLNRGGRGHQLLDNMWPWDAGASQTTAAVGALLPSFPSTDVVRPVDVLDHRALGYCYDDEPNCPCPDAAVITPPVGAIHGEASPGLDIPDNQPQGVVSNIQIAQAGSLSDITVAVDITHTYRGDLRVILVAPSGVTAELHSPRNDPTPNLQRNFGPGDTPDLANLAQGQVGIQGQWTLHVSDNFSRDVGRLNSWSLDLRPN